MEQPGKGTTLLIAIVLTTILIASAAVIAFSNQQATPFQKSEDYWNQVHVSEYLAEKTFNGSAKVLRGGLGRVVVEVDGRAYEYKCEGAFNCTEGFVHINVSDYHVGVGGNGTE